MRFAVCLTHHADYTSNELNTRRAVRSSAQLVYISGIQQMIGHSTILNMAINSADFFRFFPFFKCTTLARNKIKVVT